MTAVKQCQRNKNWRRRGRRRFHVVLWTSQGNLTRSGREEDSVTCTRRRRVATEAGDGSGKRANDTYELSAMFFFVFLLKSTLFPVKWLHCEFGLSSPALSPEIPERSFSATLALFHCVWEVTSCPHLQCDEWNLRNTSWHLFSPSRRGGVQGAFAQ